MVTELDKQTALILIDLQKGIINQNTAAPAKEAVANSAKLAEAFQKVGWPVVHVNVKPGGKWLTTRKDAKPAQSMDSLPPQFFELISDIPKHENDIFITKHSWNAFYDTALDEELKKRNITGIVLAGVSTSIGVEGTARAASERGYNLCFAKDAMADMVAEAHERSLTYILPRMGEVDTTDAILKKVSEQ